MPAQARCPLAPAKAVARSTAAAANLLLRCRYIAPEYVRSEIAKVLDDLFVAGIRGLRAGDVREIARHAFGQIDLVFVSCLRGPVMRIRKGHQTIALFVIRGLPDVDRVTLCRVWQRRFVIEFPNAVLNETAEEKANVVHPRRRCFHGDHVTLGAANHVLKRRNTFVIPHLVLFPIDRRLRVRDDQPRIQSARRALSVVCRSKAAHFTGAVDAPSGDQAGGADSNDQPLDRKASHAIPYRSAAAASWSRTRFTRLSACAFSLRGTCRTSTCSNSRNNARAWRCNGCRFACLTRY